MSIPQITQLPPAPQRSDASADFVAKADAHVASLSQFVTQTNQVVADINQISPQVADDAALASASAASASGIANYKGLWSSLTGALNVPASVKHNGSFYFLVNNLANVTTSQPGSSSDWQLIVNVGNIRKSLLDSPLCRLFVPNKIVDTLAGSLTWTRASTATYVDRYGIVKTAANDELREEKEGWLIEGASTNLLTYSSQFDNAAWFKTNVTITPNLYTAPDGTVSADRYQSSGSGFISQAKTLTGNVTLSFWVKSNGQGKDDFRILANSGSAGLTATNKWQRFTYTVTAVGGTVSYGIVQPTSGADVDIQIWGAQLEQLPFASSYIPTTTAPATRARDDVTVPVRDNFLSAGYNSEFSLVVSFLSKTGLEQGLFGATTQLGSNARYFLSTTGASVSFRNMNTSTIALGAIEQGDANQVCVSYRQSGNLNTGYVNGIQSVSVSREVQDSLNLNSSVLFGSVGGSLLPFYGHIRDFRIYDFALNADEAQFLAGVK